MKFVWKRNKSNRYSFTMIFIYLFVFIANSQEIAKLDYNSNFSIEKIKIPKSKKHKTIVGRLSDGSILVQCTSIKKPEGKKVTRQFFWINETKEGEIKIRKSKNQLPNVNELTSLDKKTIFYIQEIKGKQSFFLAKLDDKGNIVSEKKVLENWNGKMINPFIFKIKIADYPMLIFASKPDGRNDYDLFISKILNQEWTYPKSMDNLNTRFNEINPFVSKDDILFFSSDRNENNLQIKDNPDYNIWFALPNLSENWDKTPVNPLPVPFTTNANEKCISINKKRLGSGFLISDRKKNRFELYHFVSKNQNTEALPPRYHALVIGVSDYQNMKKLDSPVTNAQQLANILKSKYCFEVDLLLNPTAEEILNKIKRYRYLEENEYLLISFFGHAINQPVALAAVDSYSDGTLCISPTDYANALSVIEHPKHILTILDACWSGLFQPQVRAEFDRKSRKILTSTENFVVPDDSPFFKFLMKRLNETQEGFNGGVLFSYINIKMNAAAAIGNNVNKPKYFEIFGKSGGDFPFSPCKN